MYKIDKVCVYIANAGLIFMVFTIAIDIILRTAFGKTIPSIQQLDSELIMNLIVWLGISYVFLMGKHIQVDFIAKRLPQKIQIFLSYFCNIAQIACFAFIGYYTALRTIQAFSFGEVSNSVLGYPLWPLYVLAPIGCFLIIIRTVMYLIPKGRKSIEAFREKEIKLQGIEEVDE